MLLDRHVELMVYISCKQMLVYLGIMLCTDAVSRRGCFCAILFIVLLYVSEPSRYFRQRIC